MKSNLRKTLVVSLFTCAMSLRAINADAFIDMRNRERVQAISWSIEGATVVTIVLVFCFIWRMAKRAQEHKKSKQEKSEK